MHWSLYAFLAAIIIGRFAQMNSFRKLEDAEKLKVMAKDIMRISQLTLFVTIGIVILFFLLINYLPEEYVKFTYIFFTLLIAQSFISFSITRKKLIAKQIPPEYLNASLFAFLIRIAGMGLFIYFLINRPV